MTKKMKRFLLLLVTLSMSLVTGAESRDFKLGQWIQINNSILKGLDTYYVDTLSYDRIMKAGIDAMLESIDPYTVFIPESENEDFELMINKTYGGIGAIIHKKKGENVIINEPYYGSPAWKNGIVCGDEIIAIDGAPVADLESKDASEKMKGKPGTKVVFTMKKVRSGEVVEVPVVREKIHLPDVEYAGMLDDTTGYIQLSGFTEGASEEVKKSFLKLKEQGMKRLFFDLRGNGGGLMNEAVNIVSLFVPKGSLVVSSKGRASDTTNEYRTQTEPIDTQMPLVIMIDGGSASSSEIVTGAIQDMDRGTVMGTRSYGKGLVQRICPLPYNGQLKVTISKYYTPSGRCVQAIDYSHRNEDGSVGHIPDSLTHEFTTAHGRKVRDGGGITPDHNIPFKAYGRIVYSVVYGGILDSYAIEYVRKHESIGPLDQFHITDQDFEDFVNFAKTQEFDYRSSAKTSFDNMKKELEKDGMADEYKEQIEAMEKVVNLDKEQALRLKKDEIIPFLEEEIAVRYYYQEAGVKIRLRYDTQLKEALTKPMISF